MLEQLFGSRTRVKLLRLFLTNPTTSYFVRELTRKIDEQLNSVRRELANLAGLGVLTTNDQSDKKYYQLNNKFVLAEELKNLLVKSQLLVEEDLIKRLKAAGKIKLLVLTGLFTGAKQSATDILVAGKVDHGLVVRAVERYQREVGRELNFTILSVREYKERHNLGDKFLLTIMNGPKLVVLDETAND